MARTPLPTIFFLDGQMIMLATGPTDQDMRLVIGYEEMRITSIERRIGDPSDKYEIYFVPRNAAAGFIPHKMYRIDSTHLRYDGEVYLSSPINELPEGRKPYLLIQLRTGEKMYFSVDASRPDDDDLVLAYSGFGPFLGEATCVDFKRHPDGHVTATIDGVELDLVSTDGPVGMFSHTFDGAPVKILPVHQNNYMEHNGMVTVS